MPQHGLLVQMVSGKFTRVALVPQVEGVHEGLSEMADCALVRHHLAATSADAVLVAVPFTVTGRRIEPCGGFEQRIDLLLGSSHSLGENLDGRR